MDNKQIQAKAKLAAKANKDLVKALKKKPGALVDELFQNAHEKIFSCTDCLKCANCCKTTGPLWTNKDIERVAKHLRMKPANFIQKYLKIDDDNDYVLQTLPCPFLAPDNFCNIYEVRPKACREYPHTDRVNQKQILNLAKKNTAICPAVLDIFEEIRKKIER